MTTAYYTIPTVATGPSEHLTLVTGWERCDVDTRMASLALLISRLKDTTARGAGLAEIVLSIFLCALPDMGTHLSGITSMSMTSISATAQTAAGFVNGNRQQAGPLAHFFNTSPPDQDAVEMSDADGLYAAVASILMAFGKQAGNGPDAAIMKSRPDALVSRFTIPEPALLCLPGHIYGPTQEDLKGVFDTMSTYSEVRMLVTQYFLGVAQNVGHPPRHLEIIMTNFRLLRGTQLTHMGAIIKFMNMHPWSIRVPELTPYYMAFAAELVEYGKIPDAAREYHRMLVPQADFLFVSSNYRPLIAVAGDFVKDVEAKFSGYIYNASEFTSLIMKVRSYEPSNAHFIGTNDLAQKLGVADMSLPSRSRTGGSTTVNPI